jgi:ABC-2 type transport system permease protein
MNRMLLVEVREEVLGILREPAALVFSVLMPVAFYALSVGVFGSEGADGAIPFATYGTFAVLAVLLLTPGISLSEAREIGWLRVKRVSGTPLWVTLLAKVLAAVPYAVTVLAAMVLVTVTIGSMEVDMADVVAVSLLLTVAGLPLALIGMAVGARMKPNGATALLNAVLFTTVIASGLWFPLEILPEWIQGLAPWLPPYHLSQLALSQVTGGPWLAHAGVMVLTAAIAALGAGWAYRTARP